LIRPPAFIHVGPFPTGRNPVVGRGIRFAGFRRRVALGSA